MGIIVTKLVNTKNSIIFWGYSIVIISITFFAMEYIFDFTFFKNAYKFVDDDKLMKLYIFKEKYGWIIYIIIPVFSLVKFVLVALCLYIGTLLQEYKVSFNKIFKITIICESVFLLSTFINFVAFFTKTNLPSGISDSLSLLRMFNGVTSYSWLIYPFKTINIFEVLYILSLAFFMRYLTNKNFGKMIIFVLMYYGIGLLLWLLMVTSFCLYFY